VALRDDGRIVSWGSQAYIQDAPTDAGYVAIACSHHRCAALRDDGRVVTWGRSTDGQTDDVPTDAGFYAPYP